ncbi:hypothetical protein [Halalkalicoccus salilacus]|uniref:hypothetical protein n=1 Tax=Halalkalicoccus sp. GCM10025704 TaxID=3252662 RepID=UPI00361C2CEB
MSPTTVGEMIIGMRISVCHSPRSLSFLFRSRATANPRMNSIPTARTTNFAVTHRELRNASLLIRLM